MGAPKKADWREGRRKRAWQLNEEGWRQKDISIALGVSEGAEAYEFRGDVWTASRVAEVIKQTDRGCAITAIMSAS